MIKFSYEGKDYELGFNRKTAERAQRAGVDIDEISVKPLVQIPLFVYWAFQMNHSGIKREKTEEIYEKIGGKTEMLAALIEDYVATYTSLFDSENADGEGSENLIKWSNE